MRIVTIGVSATENDNVDDNKISDVLKNGLFDPQAIDSDTDSSLYIE
tara:strand:- start:158 stop:298 length:141 start_codon:yes stop_codon:yes gene_type:complete